MSNLTEMISIAAYYRWIENPDSDSIENWLEAEKQVLSASDIVKEGKLNIDYLRSGTQFVNNENEKNIEAKHLDKNTKLDEFYNKSLEGHSAN